MGNLLLIFVLCISTLEAKTLELHRDSRTIYIEGKEGWEIKHEIFGMPHLYFSPAINGERSNISFTDTGADLEIDSQSLATTQEKYQKNKRSWAATTDVNIISFIPLKAFKNRQGHQVHKIGVSYESEQQAYVENSFYIECRGRIIFSKSLRLSKNVQHDRDFNDLIESLDCGGL